MEPETEVVTEDTFALRCGHLGKILTPRLKVQGIPQIYTPLKKPKWWAGTDAFFLEMGLAKECSYPRVIIEMGLFT